LKLLLDTCAFLWLETDTTRVSSLALGLVSNPANELWLSVASVWEVIVKQRIGKLRLLADVADMVQDQIDDNDARLLDLEVHHVLVGRTLPLTHHDPFDRILICQALAEGLTVLTPDHNIRQYPVPTEW
jgi:PIN domain nuclease of toxin-antitoxin system